MNKGVVNFNPTSDIGSLDKKVVFVTGGTAGIGAETVRHLAAHNPAHVYFSGRNVKSGQALVASIQKEHPQVGLTFVQMDLMSLASVKAAAKTFAHDRLDILICNAGIMTHPPGLSKDGYEVQFATNHLGHAMLIQCLLSVLLRTAEQPGSDVRVLTLSSQGYQFHTKAGIHFEKLESGNTMASWFLGAWYRYGQSKLANILYASELARRYPKITSVSIHPGVVMTPLVNDQPTWNRVFIKVTSRMVGEAHQEPAQGAWNTVWAAAAAKKDQLTNGGFYIPVGLDSTEKLDKTARDEDLARRLWEWTDKILERI